MTLTVLDPRTGKRVSIEVQARPRRSRGRRRLLRELDRLGASATEKPHAA
jgi:hypothetical protein